VGRFSHLWEWRERSVDVRANRAPMKRMNGTLGCSCSRATVLPAACRSAEHRPVSPGSICSRVMRLMLTMLALMGLDGRPAGELLYKRPCRPTPSALSTIDAHLGMAL
jgi:hypothetical protein